MVGKSSKNNRLSETAFFDAHQIVTFISRMCSVTPPTEPVVEKPCDPSPCGPNSICRPVGSQPVCSCQSGYEGVPPECRPECISSSECPPTKACVNQKCQDPCPGACGQGAQCRAVNHSPICNCPSGWTGDPLTGCRVIPCKHDPHINLKVSVRLTELHVSNSQTG